MSFYAKRQVADTEFARSAPPHYSHHSQAKQHLGLSVRRRAAKEPITRAIQKQWGGGQGNLQNLGELKRQTE